MRLIVDMNIICLAPGSGSYVYATFRKEFETDLVYRFIEIYLITRTELQTFSNDALLAPG